MNLQINSLWNRPNTREGDSEWIRIAAEDEEEEEEDACQRRCLFPDSLSS